MYFGGYSSGTSHLAAPSTWSSAEAAAVESANASLKRSYEALYHQNILGAHNTYGQSEAWLSNNYLAKYPRYEGASNLAIYPQRPGEKDCAHYMKTRICKFGDTCIFDHPLWVPEGGIPDWKEITIVAPETLPERPGVPDCPYFLKTQRCQFGVRCRFNHPKDKIASLGTPESADVFSLPERPSEPPCVFYLRTGTCNFGGTCKFHHPKDISGNQNSYGEKTEAATRSGGPIEFINLVKPSSQITPALLHNSKGLPIRMGEENCPFYLKTGSCKYGTTCRYSHPDRTAFTPPAAAMASTFLASPTANLSIGSYNPGMSAIQSVDPRLTSTLLGLGPKIYPQRPGQMECDFYMKTGDCKFRETCRFHHPAERTAVSAKVEESVKLTLAGFPRREGAILCPYYMKTGTCKYGFACKFDHPPPGEVIAMATTSQGTSAEGE